MLDNYELLHIFLSHSRAIVDLKRAPRDSVIDIDGNNHNHENVEKMCQSSSDESADVKLGLVAPAAWQGCRNCVPNLRPAGAETADPKGV